MYGYNTMPPPPWWAFPPQGPTSNVSSDPAAQITQWITSLKTLEEAFKNNKKDDKKPPEKKGPSPNIIAMMLFMLLVSPITGPTMYHFFQMSLGIIK